MKKRWIAVLPFLVTIAYAQDWEPVSRMFLRPGTEKDGVYRVSFPRSDLNVTVHDVQIEPAFALTTWIAFSRMGGMTMCMGDFVVTDAELPGAQKALLEGGFDVTAVHNHLIGETPAIKYMHFAGQGDPTRLATSFLSALKATGTPLERPNPSNATPPDWSVVEAAMKYKGNKSGKVIGFGVPRAETILSAGQPLAASNGAGSSVNFQWVEDHTVLMTSDLVLLASEVRPVIEAMHQGGITITALHNHMIDDAPRTFHMHVFATGDPKALADSMAHVLSIMNVKRP